MTGEVWPSLEWVTTDGAVALFPFPSLLPAGEAFLLQYANPAAHLSQLALFSTRYFQR